MFDVYWSRPFDDGKTWGQFDCCVRRLESWLTDYHKLEVAIRTGCSIDAYLSDCADGEDLRLLVRHWDPDPAWVPLVLIKADLDRLIRQVPFRNAVALRLHYCECLPQRVVGRLMGVGTGWVSKLCSSGVNKMAAQILKECGTPCGEVTPENG